MVSSMLENHLEELLADLVACNSVNPKWDGGPGEESVCEAISDILLSLGYGPKIEKVAPGRTNVVCSIPGVGDAQSLLLNSHVDVVGVEGMDGPFKLRREGDKLYGRGAYDMKGSAAVMLALAEICVKETPPGDIHLTFVCDEENLSIGMEHLMKEWVFSLDALPLAVIALEPTEEQIGICHKGFAWYEIAISGKAAHGSRPEEGVDAIFPLGPVIQEIANVQEELTARESHPYLGQSSLHVGTLEGGTQLPVIAAGSRLNWERRILPGESEADLENEFNRIISSAGAHTGDHTVKAKKLFSRPPLETPESAEIVKRFRNASPDSQLAGMSYWADSALAAAAGIPAVLFGPIGHGAHATDEWVSAKSLVKVYEALKKVIFGMAEPVDSLLI